MIRSIRILKAALYQWAALWAGSLSADAGEAARLSETMMPYRILETARGPAVQFHDWALTLGNLPTDHAFRQTREAWKPGGEGVDALFQAGGHLQLFSTSKARVTRRDYLYGGGGDVELVFQFEVERMGPGGKIVFHLNGTHRGGDGEGFRVVISPGEATVFHRAIPVGNGFLQTTPEMPHELVLATLARHYQVRLNGRVLAQGTISQASQDNEGWTHLETMDAGIRLLAFTENFIAHDLPFAEWRKTERLYRESFGEESWDNNWIVNGIKPTVTDQFFLFHPMSNVILNRRFEGPIAVEIEATPMPNPRFSAGLTDAIFIWMMDHPEQDLPGFMRRLPDAGRQHYEPVAFYWMDMGGTNNVTTRLRRSPHLRLVRQFTDEPRLLRRHASYRITLVQNGSSFEFWVDGKPWVRAHDPDPLTSGHIGHRSFNSELKITSLEVWRIQN